MRTIIIATLVLSVAACGRDETETAPPVAPAAEVPATTAAADISPVAAQRWLDDVQFAPGARRASTTQFAYDPNTFLAGQPVTLGMTVKDAPAGTAVKVIWYGPKGRMNAETKHVRAAGERLEFSTLETSAWGVGEGRAEVWVGDEKIGDFDFELVSER